jgi:hypothetical protein
MWIGTADADYIYHETGTTPFHATHIVLHELAHMLLGHQHTTAWDQLISLLAPDVDQALIQLILGRSTYGTAEEREAETLASLIFSRAAFCLVADQQLGRPIGHPAEHGPPTWRRAGDAPDDPRAVDGPAHQDEPGCLGTDVVARHRAKMILRSAIMTAHRTMHAGSQRAADECSLGNCSCLV